ncbi:MAG TPA: biotin--[acetyl-CoA-carboxylase] ligase [Marmoricola sp.]|nr:biotin--[acetyl-CoA-carboxylase] ligase [Marmoricola sp.]
MTSSPDPRSPLEQADLQVAAGPDWVVALHETAGSTNALAAADPQRNLVVVADHQTAGRGRLDRSWETPPRAALTFSAVFDPVVETEWWPLIPLAAGIAVARAVGDDARLKWPNDVLLGEEKVSGILVERLDTRPAYAVIGIGINVDQDRAELPVPSAISLALAGIPRDRTELFGEVLRQLWFALVMLASDPHSVAASYRGLSATLDRPVRVHLPDGSVLEGIAFDVDDHGGLVIAHPEPAGTTAVPASPRTTRVAAGDVVHVRPGE